MPTERLESALIIEVPEAEPAVQRHRERLDANAPLGIPAHITVLAPFMPPGMIDTAILTQIEQLFADLAPFRFQLSRPDWFGDQVLWLAPQDPAPFRALTRLVYQAFPAYPPFEGRHDNVVPHLTIGHGHPLSELRTAEHAIQAHLPIEASVAAITLMTEQSAGGHWARTATFALSAAPPPAAADMKAMGKVTWDKPALTRTGPACRAHRQRTGVSIEIAHAQVSQLLRAASTEAGHCASTAPEHPGHPGRARLCAERPRERSPRST